MAVAARHPVVEAWRAANPPRAVGLPHWWLMAASFLVGCGLVFVYIAKTGSFGEVSLLLRRGEMVNLNAISGAEALRPFVDDATAEKTFAFLRAARPVANVGRLSRVLRISKLKPAWVVRTPEEFRRIYIAWCALYLSGFYVVWLVWRG